MHNKLFAARSLDRFFPASPGKSWTIEKSEEFGIIMLKMTLAFIVVNVSEAISNFRHSTAG